VAQLPESEFEVDPGLRDIIEAQIKQEEEAVRQVMLCHLISRLSCGTICPELNGQISKSADHVPVWSLQGGSQFLRA